jgi:O-antigen/teichoic acid export membrane protein
LDYTKPIFFFTLSFALLYSIDIIFARHFLAPQEAGWYGALSTLGKIIYFLVSPLSLVLFPMASRKKSQEEKSDRLFRFSFSLAILIAIFLTAAYFLFPNLILRVFYGEQFLPAATYLGLFGVFLSFYSLAYFLGNFMLSQEKTKPVAFLPFLALLLQVVLILFFHESILAILGVSIFACGLLFLSFLVYYLISKQQKAF